MVAAGPVHIHLLQEEEIGRDGLHRFHGAGDIFPDRLRRAGAALLTSVHKEAVVVAVSSKTDVIRGGAVQLPGGDGPAGGIPRRFHGERLVVLHPVVGGKDVDKIAQDCCQQECHYTKEYLPWQFYLFHRGAAPFCFVPGDASHDFADKSRSMRRMLQAGTCCGSFILRTIRGVFGSVTGSPSPSSMASA